MVTCLDQKVSDEFIYEHKGTDGFNPTATLRTTFDSKDEPTHRANEIAQLLGIKLGGLAVGPDRNQRFTW